MPKPNEVPPPYVANDVFLRRLAAELAHMPIKEVQPPVYRLGDGQRNSEIIVGGHRVLTWGLTGEEKRVAHIAGWDTLAFQVREEDKKGYIFVPAGTRNARSVLSGMEAYEGEKTDIVSAAVDYLRDVKSAFGHEDTGFSWTSVGITPRHNIFIAPPFLPVSSVYGDDIMRWKFDIAEELRILLQNDSANAQLIENFRAELG